MRHAFHKLICWYLRRCAGAFHCYPYGEAGRYVVLLTEVQYAECCKSAACGSVITCNPNTVPSIRVNGIREPICKNCADEWNRLHRTSKGLEIIPIDPTAYEGCPEEELP